MSLDEDYVGEIKEKDKDGDEMELPVNEAEVESKRDVVVEAEVEKHVDGSDRDDVAEAEVEKDMDGSNRDDVAEAEVEKDMNGSNRDDVADNPITTLFVPPTSVTEGIEDNEENKGNDEKDEENKENEENEDEDSDAMDNKGEDNDVERIIDVVKKRRKKGLSYKVKLQHVKDCRQQEGRVDCGVLLSMWAECFVKHMWPCSGTVYMGLKRVEIALSVLQNTRCVWGTKSKE
ncbi:hypothetical protein Droror1_Dr00027549 [Drosera rotundifolia]